MWQHIQGTNHHMQTFKMSKHEILTNKCVEVEASRLDDKKNFFPQYFLWFLADGRRVARKARYIVQFYI